MHRLARITMVNWYLYEYESIPINVDVAYFKGANGAGKSSLADALQAIFAGGDERKIALNAASSDNKKSGRTLLSYVLGVVAESSGMSAIPPREASNCYLCVTFQRPDGSYYSFGLSMFARSGDTRLIKNRFIIDGEDLSSLDFMQGSDTVVPWGTMEKRLINKKGTALFPNNAAEYRQRYCELMSGPGINGQISADMMLKAFKNGIAFKEQTNINEFICNYILPENHIDVGRIDNDYAEYKKIQLLIENARDKLELLKQTITSYNRHQQKNSTSLAYKWCEHEAYCCSAEDALNKVVDQEETLKEEIVTLEETIRVMVKDTDTLRGASETATQQLYASDAYTAQRTCQFEIDAAQDALKNKELAFRDANQTITNLCEIELPENILEQVQSAFLAIQEQINLSAGIDSGDLIDVWYSHVSSIEAVLHQLYSAKDYLPTLRSERDRLKKAFDEKHEEFTNLKEAYKTAQAGDVTLMDSTAQLISILAREGIDATPVCELASISDDSWQVAIETFLRTNREALVIDSEQYARAIVIYRNEKNRNNKLRQVKLINPDKGFGFEGVPSPDMAANLIDSDHPVARKFLRGLLHNVKLVETESELRREKRAITRDAMVAGNGAISGGGAPIKWVMLGQAARKQHAALIQNQAQKVAPLLATNEKAFNQFEIIEELIRTTVSKSIEQSSKLPTILAEFELKQASLDQNIAKLANLNSEGNEALILAASDCKTAFDDASARLIVSNTDFALKSQNLEGLQKSVSTLDLKYKAKANERDQYESKEGYDQQLAMELFEKLSEQVGEERFTALAMQAKTLSESDSVAAGKAHLKATEKLTHYLSIFEPEDKKELASLAETSPHNALIRCQEHHDRIESADIVIHLNQSILAREKMLNNFRAEVVAKLKESFQQIEHTFTTLNSQLSQLTFNSNKYRFLYPLTEIESLNSIHAHVTDTSDLDNDSVGTLFDESKDDPAVKIIEDLLLDGRLHEISDYRNFYNYDIRSTDINTGTERKFSELLKTGSGGEKQAPFYVALGASFMTAYKIRKTDNQVSGGAAIAVFDEAFNKMDGNNAKAALAFFREIGLQVIIAAPPESEIKTGPYVDKTYTILREGDRVYIDHHTYTQAGKSILETDDHNVSPEILEEFLDKVKAEFKDESVA